MKRLTHSQVMQMLITPRAALDRMIACGSIDYDDLGALQCVYVLAIEIDNISGKQCPDPKIIVGLVQQIENGIEVLQERIEKARLWLDQYAIYLRSVDYKCISKAIENVRNLCKSA